MGAGFLGAMKGLGDSVASVGEEWSDELKQQRIAELKGNLATKQDESAYARSLERDEVAHGRAVERDETRFEREKGTADTKHRRTQELQGSKHKNTLREIAARAKSAKSSSALGNKAGGYSAKDLDTRIASTVATGQKMNVDGLDWDEDKEKTFAKVTASVRETFLQDPGLGVVGAYNAVVNPSTPLSEQDLSSPAGSGPSETPVAPGTVKDLGDPELNTAVSQIQTLLDQGYDKQTLRDHAYAKGTPEWQIDILFEAAGR